MTHIDCVEAFSEIMFLLLSGCGVGYSVQSLHIEKLPPINKPLGKYTRKYLIGDSIEGWSDAIKVLLKSYFKPYSSKIKFDFSAIREKGAEIKTGGGKAPGPEPLKECIEKVTNILNMVPAGQQLNSLEIHDIICHMSNAVLAGRSEAFCLYIFF